MKNYHTLLLIILFGLVGQIALAQKSLVLSNPQKTYLIGLDVEYIEDFSKKLTIESVKNGKDSTRFRTHTKSIPNFGYKDANYWFRVRLKAPNNNQWLLHIDHQAIDYMLAYQFNEQGQLIDKQESGRRFQFFQRPVLYRTFLIPLLLNSSQESITLYLFFSGTNTKLFPLEISSQNLFFKNSQQEDATAIIICGILLSLTFYNVFIYFSVREKAYIYYVLYMFFNALFLLGYQGFVFQYLFPYYPPAAKLIVNTAASLSVLFSIFFTTSFLRTAFFFPRLYRISIALKIALSVNILVIVLTLYSEGRTYLLPLELSALVVAFATLFNFMIGIVTLRKKFRPAQFYVIAWSLLLISLCIATLRQLNILEYYNNLLVQNSYQLASALEALMLSLGLADKINVERRARNEAQQDSITLLEENEKIIQAQNQFLAQKVQERTQTLEKQKLILEEKNESIIASINYALRIQKAIIPTEEQIQALIPNSFVYYVPKDIVSGDFYWIAEKENTLIVAVADCTGHGVSGAFMTMIANNLLNQVIHDEEIHLPHLILNRLTVLLQQTLLREEHKIDDGMDIAIISITKEQDHQKVLYAGAMNSLYYFEKGILNEIKADKVGIGDLKNGFESYQLHQCTFQSPTLLYLCSDGYKDQFGGEKFKKIGSNSFRQLLTENAQKPLSERKPHLHQYLKNWQKTHTQTDDILIVGIEI
ncbi:MAG: hypothetical protein EAZ55_13790 [Cytophagales bacterium]|nr:MAG: hypothetical protein EAZ55_13790 [Cytophagales bacterium]